MPTSSPSTATPLTKAPLTTLGNITVEQFLKEYWQQKPLLIRNAFPDFESPLSPDELAGLALEEDIESRIILEQGKTGPWELRCGPFEEQAFQLLPDSHWTLLLQAVDQWVPEVNELLDRFRFIPNWRLDDIMISYAADKGSVGPHFDYYDVFLLQGYGRRRWQLGQQCDVTSARREDTDLHILKHFEANQDWILKPGDMLYIPPQLAHQGIAQGECITYSIGFRAPSYGDIIGEFSQELISTLDNDQRYTDPKILLQDNPGEISDDAIAQLQAIIQQQLTDKDKLTAWFGRYMTSRKYPVPDDDTEGGEYEPLSTEDWLQELQGSPLLYRHPAARFAYRCEKETPEACQLFIDGFSFACTTAIAEILCRESIVDYQGAKSLFSDNDQVAFADLIAELLKQGSLVLEDPEHV